LVSLANYTKGIVNASQGAKKKNKYLICTFMNMIITITTIKIVKMQVSKGGFGILLSLDFGKLQSIIIIMGEDVF
jgi:hypothetical protein